MFTVDSKNVFAMATIRTTKAIIIERVEDDGRITKTIVKERIKVLKEDEFFEHALINLVRYRDED